MRDKKYRFMVSLCFFLTSVAQWAVAAPVTTIRNNGNSANRVDLAVLGDGYTAAELDKYASDVQYAVEEIFNQEPFKEYQNYFNVHRIDVVSNQSGADHPENGVFKDTAFDATYNCGGTQRLICVNVSKVYDVLYGSLSPDQMDLVLVIVNDPEYGGSGGSVAVASTDPSIVELALHEMGHSFGLLADEYDYGSSNCSSPTEPSAVNVTIQTDLSRIKWNVGDGPPTGWIEHDTPIPTTTTAPGVVGLYLGANYCTNGYFRPTYNSKMRNLYKPYEQVNEEQLIKRIYNWVSPLDSSQPAANSLSFKKGVTQVFQVGVPDPLTGSMSIAWYVDNQYVSPGSQFTLDTTDLDYGIHSIKVVVKDTTPKVRNDPFNVLTDNKSWTFNVAPNITSINRTVPIGALTNQQTVSYTVTFSASVAGVGSSNFNLPITGITGASITSVTGGGSNWTVTVDTGTGDGTLGLNLVNTTGITDILGNSIPALSFSGETYTIDRTAPTINISAPSNSTTKFGPISYTITYTGADAVSLTKVDVILNKTGNAAGTIAISDSGTNSRTVTLSSITGDGTLGISIKAGTASDNAGNTAFAKGPSTSFNVDNTPPILIIGPPSATLTKSGPVPYTITYSGADTITLGQTNVTLNRTDTANGSVAVTGSGNTRTVTISSITGDGSLGISIAAGTATDQAGNSAAAAGPSTAFIVDNTAPTVLIGLPSVTSTKSCPVSYNVSFSGAHSISLTPDETTLNRTGTANGNVAVSGSGNSWTITISGISGDGTLGVSIAAGVATDTAGNSSLGVGPSITFIVNHTLPAPCKELTPLLLLLLD